MTTKKWKDGLLKSSLPLEQLVAEVLANQKFFVCGEYSYLRTNENGLETEFSVDLEAFDLLPEPGGSWGELRLLIECKYNYPTVRWVFAPHVNMENIFGGVITCFDHLCTQTIPDSYLSRFDRAFEYCVSGIELHENGEVNRQSITRAIHQLRYATLTSAVREAEIQMGTWNDVDLAAGLYCSILVTTSALYVLKRGVSLAHFQKVETIEEVAVLTPALVISNDNGPQLDREVAQQLATLHRENPDIKTRLIQIANLTGQEIKTLGATWSFDHAVRFAPHNILVVNYSQLDGVLKKLRQTVSLAGRHRKRIAYLRRDLVKRTKWIDSTPEPEAAE